MAAPIGRQAVVRVRVQVVASLLSPNLPVHVDSFWLLVKSSDTPTIGDVESRLVDHLNNMGRQHSVMLAVHSPPSPILASPVPTQHSNCVKAVGPTEPTDILPFLRNTTLSHKDVSESSLRPQQISIILLKLATPDLRFGKIKISSKGKISKLGLRLSETPELGRVLKLYDISQRLESSLHMVFFKRLVLMEGCVLLSDSKSDILRDNDTLVISALCGLSVKNAIEKEPGWLDERSQSDRVDACAGAWLTGSEDRLLWDSDESDLNQPRVKVSLQIRNQIGIVFQKLALLKSAGSNKEQGSRKSRKRKVSPEGSDTEETTSSEAVQTTSVVEPQNHEKINQLYFVSDTPENNSDVVLVNETKSLKKKTKQKQKRSRRQVVVADLSNITSMLEIKNAPDLTEPACGPVFTETANTSVISFDLLHPVLTRSINESVESDVKGQMPPHESITKDRVVSSDAVTVTQAEPSEGKKTVRSKRKRPAGFELSSLLMSLRGETDERGQATEATDQILEDTGCQELTRLEESQVCLFNSPEQSNQLIPKKKRTRKRKNKKGRQEQNNTIVTKVERPSRNYTLNLPEHQRPMNSRVTFEEDSEEEEDVTMDINVSSSSANISSTLVDEGLEISHNPSSSVVKCVEIVSVPDQKEITTTAYSSTQPMLDKLFPEAGVPINPDEKFKSLLCQYGRVGRQMETISSANGPTIIRSSHKRWRRGPPMADAVDPENDVLTNVSTITQSWTEPAEVSKETSLHQIPTGQHQIPVDQHQMLASGGCGSQNSSVSGQLSLSAEPNNCVDRSQPLLEPGSLPSSGDVITFKVLELADDYTPILSGFKEAKVIQVDVDRKVLLLEPKGSCSQGKTRKSGRFEMELDNGAGDSDGDEGNLLMTVSMEELANVRLVSRAT